MGQIIVNLHFPDNCKYFTLKKKQSPWGILQDLKAVFTDVYRTQRKYIKLQKWE